MSAELRAVLEELIDYERHNCLCPAAEWSGTRPACDCDWDELEAAARAALASTSIDGVSGTGLEEQREVEAALPDGWYLGSVTAMVKFDVGFQPNRRSVGWTAEAYDGRFESRGRIEARGDSVSAALRNLRAALAKDGDSGG